MTHLREACGVIGIYAPGEDVARLTFFGLFALQHRGQESAGIATADGHTLKLHANMGLVSQVFSEDSLTGLTGHVAIGHTRYSTTGSSKKLNVQPIVVGEGAEAVAVAHNGNVINAKLLREELTAQGIRFTTSSDTEVIAQLILAAPEKDFQQRIRYAMNRLQGAYALTVLTRDALYAVRDPLGVRPLCFGKINGNGWVVASESCALNHIGAALEREVGAGEIIAFDENGMTTFQGEPVPRGGLCIFEYIYFARPDSVINGKLLHPVRQMMGRILAREHPVEADLVMGVPDSATAAGIGYAVESGIEWCEGVIKNRYVGRTFIEPEQRIRDLGVKMKFNPMPQILEGKRLVVVDDSIVRGTTTPQVVDMLRRAGAKEVHMRVTSPPICRPCFFGVDMATRWELIASRKTVPEICDFIGADSLGYLSLDGLVRAVGLPHNLFCTACFTGDYPIPVQLEMDKLALETDLPPGIAALSTADGGC
jgi:amidophosphoribosyltransferase